MNMNRSKDAPQPGNDRAAATGLPTTDAAPDGPPQVDFLGSWLDGSPVAQLAVDARGVVRYANQAARAILGRDGRRLVGEPFGVPSTPGRKAEIDVVGSEGPPRTLEILAHPVPGPDGPFHLVALYDVTDRKQAGEVLQFLAESGSLLSSSLDLPTTAATIASLAVRHLCEWCVVDLFDADDRLRRLAAVHADDKRHGAMERLFDPPPAETAAADLLRPPPDGVAPDEAPVLLHPPGDDVLALLFPTPAQRDVARAAGVGSLMIVPLVARERALGYAVLARSERLSPLGVADWALAENFIRRAALALDNSRLYEETRTGVRRRDEFLAMLAHELRNPLAPVVNAARLLEILPAADDAVRRAGGVIRRQAETMGRLLEDLLDISRVVHGKIDLRFERLHLQAFLKTLLETNAVLFVEQASTVETSFPSEPLYVEADPIRLEQVFLNLLQNAAKFSARGGRIGVAVVKEPSTATVVVRDDGIGISPDMLRGIFDLFAQGNQGPERSGGGLGIGLTLVRSLLEGHGGSIEAKSDGPGRGSEFIVRLPLPTAATEGVAPPVRDPEVTVDRRPAAGVDVLIVEDNDDGRESLSDLLG
ncbi:MAG: ATP-binding protein, partial [Planctomycetia bacterium]